MRNKRNKRQTANIGVGHTLVPVGALTPLTGRVQEKRPQQDDSSKRITEEKAASRKPIQTFLSKPGYHRRKIKLFVYYDVAAFNLVAMYQIFHVT